MEFQIEFRMARLETAYTFAFDLRTLRYFFIFFMLNVNLKVI